MRIKICIITILILFSYTKNYAQDSYNMWYQYLMSAKLEKKNLNLLAQYRSFDLGADPRIFLLSASLDFEVSKNVKPGFGLMYLDIFSYIGENKKKTRQEIRPFQQVTLNTYIDRLSLLHRFSMEERFLSNPQKFTVRFRYLMSMRIPFNKKDTKELVYGIFKNEVLINAVKNGAFDSDRITAGIGVKLNKNSAIEFGLLNLLENNKSSQYGLISFKNNFDWRKSKK